MEGVLMRAYRSWIAAVTLIASAHVAGASDWGRYANARYAFLIDIPPGFSAVVESGDGGTSMSADGEAELRVWGGYLTDNSFAGEVAWRIRQDESDGWEISYHKRGKQSASWSGSKGGRILYERSVVGCDGAAIYFSVEYDRSDLAKYDLVVKELVKSLRRSC
jgi:hypothetical protein